MLEYLLASGILHVSISSAYEASSKSKYHPFEPQVDNTADRYCSQDVHSLLLRIATKLSQFIRPWHQTLGTNMRPNQRKEIHHTRTHSPEKGLAKAYTPNLRIMGRLNKNPNMLVLAYRTDHC